MQETQPDTHVNVYQNLELGALPNPLVPQPAAADEAFAASANQLLSRATELLRALVGAHQAGAALIVQQDWASVRRFFSLSEKYAAWASYREPADGDGIHGWFLDYNRPLRLTQAELERHPAWANFGDQLGQHPPIRGWMAAPLLARDGSNWGLLQVSDKYVGEFTAEDERQLVRLAEIVSLALGALWDVRDASQAQEGEQRAV